MEQSEDYTRVISHGPNPRITHIFYTCIMENSGNGYNSLRKEIRFSTDGESSYPSDDFLAFCNACRKKLGQGKDVFMYRRNGIL
ncbi:FCS-Like Zinc finger 11-like isoform X2 [Dendrobium catenatum]|uniref:FCS-Like Zinc finger 11-like isoform X2 n=1 Tax=Dendrobium catenatum TaxID=906689 RepID=UPI0010A03DED|nr:FCS-Like Zinc finger 11-like isoform X2 [Dendrobium catenatum]